jgi:hypothetical protein
MKELHLNACLNPARELAGHCLPDGLNVCCERLLQDIVVVPEQE